MEGIDIFKKLVEAEERRKKREQPLVDRIEIKEVLPCFTTPGYIRFTAQAEGELGEVIPILFLRFPPGKAVYNGAEGSVTLNIFNRMITIFSTGKIGVTNTRDLKEAEEILQKIKGLINEAHSTYLKTGAPREEDIEAATKVSWMNLYHHLPKTNCGECGHKTCQALAVKALLGEARLSDCTQLRETKYRTNLDELKRELGPFLLKALGWEDKR
jgi:ArsR family metal-binding transcriptional regulator